MKELSIEEKAKRYDEAIERAEEYYKKGKTIEYANYIVFDIFPELKESEDERIIEDMIETIKTESKDFPSSVIAEKSHIWLAWLEKQGKQKSLDDIAKEVTKDKDTATSFLKSTGIMNENGELADEYKIEQGEQKPTDETKFKIEEGKWYVCISQFCNCIEGRAYKATSDNRVIDDFGTEYDMHSNAYKYFRLWTIQDAKDGDVLVNWNNNIYLFKGIEEEVVKFHCYYSTNYEEFNIPFNNNSHLGLTEPQFEHHPATKEQCGLLFQKMHEAGYEWDAEKKELKKNEPIPTAEGMKIILRTKCEFAEWSEEDESTINEVIMNYESAYLPPVDKRYNIINRLKSLKDRVQTKPKQEWSEEDRRILDEVIYMSENHLQLNAWDISWLKFLKNRCLPQPRREWSEEDENGLGDALWAIQQARTIAKDENDMGNLWYAEKFLNSIKDRVQPQNKWKESLATADLENSLCDIQDGFSDTSYEYRILGEAIEFIRCTEPKPRWKPSNEQMNALHDAAVYVDKSMFPYSKGILMKLYEQLKKLREV